MRAVRAARSVRVRARVRVRHLVVEAVDLCDLSALVIASQDVNPLREPRLQH